MLVSLYILVVLLGFGSLAYGLWVLKDAEQSKNYDLAAILLMLSAIFFAVGAFYGLNVATLYCENVVLNQTILNENVTAYANAITCTTQYNTYPGFAILLGFLTFLDAILVFLCVMGLIKKNT